MDAGSCGWGFSGFSRGSSQRASAILRRRHLYQHRFESFSRARRTTHAGRRRRRHPRLDLLQGTGGLFRTAGPDLPRHRNPRTHRIPLRPSSLWIGRRRRLHAGQGNRRDPRTGGRGCDRLCRNAGVLRLLRVHGNRPGCRVVRRPVHLGNRCRKPDSRRRFARDGIAGSTRDDRARSADAVRLPHSGEMENRRSGPAFCGGPSRRLGSFARAGTGQGRAGRSGVFHEVCGGESVGEPEVRFRSPVVSRRSCGPGARRVGETRRFPEMADRLDRIPFVRVSVVLRRQFRDESALQHSGHDTPGGSGCFAHPA